MNDLFNRPMTPPATSTRQGRVRLLVEAFEAWFAGQQPSDVARLFVAGGALSWLRDEAAGANLLRDHWKVLGPQGSNLTANVLYQALLEARQGDVDEAHSAELPEGEP